MEPLEDPWLRQMYKKKDARYALAIEGGPGWENMRKLMGYTEGPQYYEPEDERGIVSGEAGMLNIVQMLLQLRDNRIEKMRDDLDYREKWYKDDVEVLESRIFCNWLDVFFMGHNKEMLRRRAEHQEAVHAGYINQTLPLESAVRWPAPVDFETFRTSEDWEYKKVCLWRGKKWANSNYGKPTDPKGDITCEGRPTGLFREQAYLDGLVEGSFKPAYVMVRLEEGVGGGSG